MTVARIIPAFDELEYGHARFGLGAELTPVEQLAFERGEEALAHGAIVCIADRSDPIEGRTPASLQRKSNATNVY